MAYAYETEDLRKNLEGAHDEPDLFQRRQRKAVTLGTPPLNFTTFLAMALAVLCMLVLTVSSSLGEGVLTAKLPEGGIGGPANPAPVTPTTRPLVIILDSASRNSCRISIDGYPESPSDFAALADILIALQYNPDRGLTKGYHKPDSPVVIRPSPNVSWDNVVNAFNAALRAKYSNVSFAAVN